MEPDYPGIPAGVKRRMGKSVRMAVGAAFPLLKISAAGWYHHRNGEWRNGRLIKFLNQIIEYNEGLLTPANFVQSTSNARLRRLRSLQKITNIILPMYTGTGI